MNTNNIKSGMVVKNYKHLCELLEEPVKGGKAKQLQIQEWRRHFAFKKQGHKYIITKIYQTPKVKTDGRERGNNTVYAGYIQKLIMDMMASGALRNETTILITPARLLLKFDMVNLRYFHFKNSKDKLSEELKISTNRINYFYMTVHSKFKRTLERSFDILGKKGYLYWSTIYIAVKKDIDGNELHEEADDDDVELILQNKSKTLQQMGIDSEKDLVKKNKWDAYINLLNSKIYTHSQGDILYVYRSYKFILNRADIRAGHKWNMLEIDGFDDDQDINQFILELEDRITLKKDLNRTITGKLLQRYKHQDDIALINSLVNLTL